jgi:hypothetical protein
MKMRSVLLAVVLIGIVGCSKPAVPTMAGKMSAVQPKVMTREEFEAKIKGLKTAQDFIDAFGKPDSTQQDRTEFLMIFKEITQDAITGKPDSRVWITFTGQGTSAVYNRHSFS